MSRKRARIAIVLLRIAIPLLCMGMMTDSTWLILVSIGFSLAGLAIPTHRCPHCGKRFEVMRSDVGAHWSKPDEGYCRECGKLLKYDDQE